jgi:hypothetical protein
MTRKEQILRFVSRLDDEVTFDRVIYHLTVMRDVEAGMEQVKKGEVIDHDKLFDRILADNAQEKTRVVRRGGKRSAAAEAVDRPASPKNGRSLHPAPKKRSQ